MPKEFSRLDRVSQQIIREVAPMLIRLIKGPKYGMISITTVKVSPDLGHAKIYISCYAPQVPIEEVIVRLNELAGEIRQALGKRLTMKYTPQLKFYYDDSIEYSSRISDILQNASDQDKQETDD